jgi:hypothetical protein
LARGSAVVEEGGPAAAALGHEGPRAGIRARVRRAGQQLGRQAGAGVESHVPGIDGTDWWADWLSAHIL